MAEEYKYLFSPLQIGSMTVKNRLFTSPFGTNMADVHFLPKESEQEDIEIDISRFDRWIDFLAERAKGGFGLIEGSDFAAYLEGCAYNMMVPEERLLPVFKKLADRIHEHGAKYIQLIHGEGTAARPFWNYRESWAASCVRTSFARDLNHEVEIEQIKELIPKYAEMADMLKRAGADGMQLQGAHGFLIASFLSPRLNKRSDEYGCQNMDNRMRFFLEIIEAVRNKVGKDFVLGTTLTADELMPGGYNLDEGKEMAIRLEEAGIDYIEARLGGLEKIPMWIGDMSVPLGVAVPLAAAIKEVVNIPVFTIDRIKDPIQAEKILENGHADMCGMARGCICDPELPNKAKEGKVDAIRGCVACHQGCSLRLQFGKPIDCIQNPAVGREKEWGIGTLKSAEKRKKVVVVGGGPGGLKAAEIAAERGHEVILYEKESELGGQVNLAKLLPTREEIGDVTRHLEYQIKDLGVKVNLNTEVTADMVKAQNPDAVVIATGSVPTLPPVPGTDQDNVITVDQLLKEEKEIGDNVVIFDIGEAHWRFAGSIDYLGKKGKKRIEAVTPLYFAGLDVPPVSLALLMGRLNSYGTVNFRPMSMLAKISGSTVTVVNVFNQKPEDLEGIDTVVIAGDHKACYDLYRQLKGEVKELYSVGDCVAPRKIDYAILDGFRVGQKI